MKQIVSEEIVRQVIDAHGAATDEERDRLAARYGGFQHELTGFVIAWSQDLPDRERATVIALLPMIYDAFIRSGAKFRQVRHNEVVHAWKLSAAFVRDLKRDVSETMYAEPEILGFMLDVMLDRDPETLVDEAPQLAAARILQTVIAASIARARPSLPVADQLSLRRGGRASSGGRPRCSTIRRTRAGASRTSSPICAASGRLRQ